ncbi:MAG: PEGA domain-containing protein [Desulforhopalus sp.]|nr:PEGA domain-containing protein [Desulforhopalus sp.]
MVYDDTKRKEFHMKKRVCSSVILVGVALILSGCCSIIHGTNQEIAVSSSPTGARVLVNGSQVGTTPATLNLKRNAPPRIRLELEDYQPYEMILTKSVSGWVWGNIVFGGLIGLAVDALDGAIYKLNPEQVSAQLLESKGNKLQIQMIKGKPERAEKIGQMKKSPAEKLKELKGLETLGILTGEEYEAKRQALVDQL